MMNFEDELRSISKSLSELSGKLDNLLKTKAADVKEQPASSGKTKKAAAKKTEKAEPETVPPESEDFSDESVTAIDMIYDIIKNSRKGISINDLKDKTGLDGKKLGNILYKLTKRGKVQTKERGVYVKAK